MDDKRETSRERDANLQIRHAQEKDIDALRKLGFYENLIELPEDEEILVAEENGTILGAVSAKHKKIRYIPKASKLQFWSLRNIETNAWIYRLFVREDQRSKGLGKELVMNMATYLCAKGIKTLYAGIEHGPFKEISRRVFLAAGFTDLGYCICMRRVCVGNLMTSHL